MWQQQNITHLLRQSQKRVPIKAINCHVVWIWEILKCFRQWIWKKATVKHRDATKRKSKFSSSNTTTTTTPNAFYQWLSTKKEQHERLFNMQINQHRTPQQFANTAYLMIIHKISLFFVSFISFPHILRENKKICLNWIRTTFVS